MRYIINIGVLACILYTGIFFTYAQSVSDTKNNIGIIQQDTSVSPTIQSEIESHGGEVKGLAGNIVANIFTNLGMIKSEFIAALASVVGNFPNSVLRWDGTKFVQGSISDDGTNISVLGSVTADDFIRRDGSPLGGNGKFVDGTPDATEAVYMDGNVGIGTTNPTEKLHVFGDSYLQGKLYLGSTDTSLFRHGSDQIATNDRFFIGPSSLLTRLYSQYTYLGSSSNNSRINLRGNIFHWNEGIIHGNGNVGIGIKTPREKLHVYGGNLRVSRGNLRVSGTGGETRVYLGSDPNDYIVMKDQVGSDSERISIVSNDVETLTVRRQKVGIGTTSPNRKLHVSSPSSDDVAIRLQDDDASWFLSTTTEEGFGIYEGGTTTSNARLSFTTQGNVGIGTTTPTEKLDVNGNIRATAFLYSSDQRLKTDISEYTDDILTKIRPVRYTWKESGKRDIGVIAQEVQKVLPELVVEGNDGHLTVDYAKLVVPLIQKVQELESRLQRLEN